MTIKNCQLAVLQAFGFNGDTVRDAERAFFDSLNNHAPGSETDAALLGLALEVDGAAERAREAATRLAEMLVRDAERFEIGYHDDNALGYSTVRDLQEARIQLEERAKALRVTISLAKGKAVAQRFLEITESNAAARAQAAKEAKKA